MSAAARLMLAAALVVTLACGAPAAGAAPPRPTDLTVAGGEETWHPDNRFELRWTNPPTGAGPPLAAVHYRIRDPLGKAIGETRLSWVTEAIAALTLPNTPGIYSAEVWLENAAAEQGLAATVHLRFDDTRPGVLEPLAVPSWIGRTSFPLTIELEHPSSPTPVAGIRGYAVAIDSNPDGAPCAAVDRCTDGEVSLPGGIEDDSVTIAALPEGRSYLHAVAVSGSGMKSTANGMATLRVDTTDPVTRLSGEPAGWANHPIRLTAAATDAGSGMQQVGGGPLPFTAIRLDDGAPTIAHGNALSVTVIGEGVHRIDYYARDAAGNVDDEGSNNGVANRPPRTALVRIDRAPPSVSFASSEDRHDPELLRVGVTDSLSGADLTRGGVGVRTAGSGDRYEPLPATPSADGELRVRWDSDAYPAGTYEFRAVGYDAAGNATVSTRRANGAPMVLSNPLKAPTFLHADLAGRMASRALPSGRAARFDGHLTLADDAPLGGMPVRIVERFAPGAVPAIRVSTATTDPGGDFSIRLAPGPSREVSAAFDGSPTLTRSASSSLKLRVQPGVRLRTSARSAKIGGAPLVFRGAVETTAGTTSAGGRTVQLQFRLPGLPWSEFRTVQTDRRGRFHYRYRFSDDDSRGARFQFRAYVPTQNDWPYEPGGSRPVAVRGV